MKITTLGYHDIVDESSVSEKVERVAPSRYTLSRASFRRHLEALREARIQVRTMGNSAEADAVLVTFDDGAIGGYNCAAVELEKFGWRGHFFITSDWIGRDGFMNREQIRELRGRGHIIGSHTVSHPARMSRLSWDELMRQWVDSRAVLSDLTGEPVTTASVSDGYYSSAVGRAAAAAGLQFLFNSEPTTEVGNVDGCSILGRYSMFSDTRAEEAVGLAQRRAGARMKQAISWQSKKLVKAVAGESYLTLRRLILSKR